MAILHLTNEAYRLTERGFGDAPAVPDTLYAARRDTAAFQILLTADRPYSVCVREEDWYSHRCTRLRGEHERLRLSVSCALPVKLHIEEFLTDDDGTKKADMLLHQSVRESDAGVPTAVWAEIEVPADAEPGDYPITVALYSSLYNGDEVRAAEASLHVHAASHVLPAPKDFSFCLDLWQHTCNIARKHDVPLWSDDHFAVLEKYAASLAALGQKSITVCASNIPWSGQNCHMDMKYGGNLYEYSMIPIRRTADGTFRYDYTRMQRYVDLCTEAGISGDIEIFGLVNVWYQPALCDRPICPDYPEFLRLRYLDEADGCMKYMRNAEDIKDYVRALEAYFISTGQIDRVRIAADEPGNVEKYRVSLDLLRELAPRFRCKCAINHAEFIEEFHDRIDDFIPYLDCVSEEYGKLMQYKAQFPDKRFLWYVCCGGARPNTYLRSDPIESRLIGIYTARLNLHGFLRWNYAIWPEDPRREIRYGFFEAGDTNFVYPAYNGGVLLSLRYKNLQRGIGDFELLQTVRARCGEDAFEELLSLVLHFSDMQQYRALTPDTRFTTDYEAFHTLKARALALLEA